MVQQHVGRADGGESGWSLGERLGNSGGEGHIAEIRAVEQRQRHQGVELEQAHRFVDVLIVDLELLSQELAHARWDLVVHLETHAGTEASAPDLTVDHDIRSSASSTKISMSVSRVTRKG